ncbi:MAG TPA: PKD domain-containing protein, partial [Gaiellaceae bacterium]|nr:PKD domain-containing protein [Gaiellaceae bacterium]
MPQQVCPAPLPGQWSCDAVRLATERVSRTEAEGMRADGLARPAGDRADFYGPAGGYSPGQLASAYGVNPAAATTQTVAIVDAYNDPSVVSDLDAFDSYYGLPAETASTFTVVDETGTVIDPATTSSPVNDVDWSGEITLDVETVRGICHACKILLVETNSSNDSDLALGVDEAVALGATIVSNSYGGPEFSGDPSASHYDHPGVAILASTGDDGWYGWDWFNQSMPTEEAPESPASYNTVVGVGGTSLFLNPSGTRASETVWNDDGPYDVWGFNFGLALGASGGGCSTVYPAWSWQEDVAGYASLGCGADERSSVDVAADADYFTGYDTYETTSWCPSGQQDGNGNDCPSSDPDWETIGGTSLASPLVAAMWALAGGPGGVTYPAMTLYGHFQTDPSQLYDVTTGGNGFCDGTSAVECNPPDGDNINTPSQMLDCMWGPTGNTVLTDRYQCNAEPGYDGVSGVGTPNGVASLEPISPTAAIQSPGAVAPGVSHAFSAAGSSAPFPGDSITQYKWNWGDGTTTTTASATTSHTYSSAGARTITLTVTDADSSANDNRTGEASIQVDVETATHTLSVTRSGAGSGTVTSSPAGVSCGATCSHAYGAGTSVTLTARASSGSTFAGWSGGGCSGTRACVV